MRIHILHANVMQYLRYIQINSLVDTINT